MEEISSAAFKHSERQMFQFPTWRTGSADVKGAKCLFRIVTTLWFFLPPPTLNLLPWSWTVWIRTVRAALWSVSWEPLTCKMQGGAFALRLGSFLPPFIFSTLMKFPMHSAEKLGHLICTAQRGVWGLVCFHLLLFLFQESFWCTFNTFTYS